MIIIGQMHGAVQGSFHCIARACVSGTYYCIDSDDYHYWKSTENSLKSFFRKIVGIYAVEKIEK